eukprot:5839949-Prymnesium_polylepis.1
MCWRYAVCYRLEWEKFPAAYRAGCPHHASARPRTQTMHTARLHLNAPHRPLGERRHQRLPGPPEGGGSYNPVEFEQAL